MRVGAAFVGCKVSQADSETALATLAAHGFGTVPRHEDADAVVVMTCCVTAEAEKKSRQLARRLARQGRRVLVAGCAATRDAGQFAHPGIEVVGGGWQAAAERLAAGGHAPFTGEAAAAESAAAGGGAAAEHPSTGAGRTRFNLKVQDGCAGACTYCIVRTVRGRPRSLPVGDALATARAALERGCGELVVTGINLAAYEGGASLADLVLALADLPGLARLRLSSLEPDGVDDALLDALAHPVVARHLHLPLQSADDGVLRAMGRRYDWRAYRATAAAVRARLGDVMLSTDVIVGFPSEDDEAFARTLAALQADLFGRVHVFAYSARPGTPAARLGRLPAAVVKARAAAAGGAAARAQQRAAVGVLGRAAEVLVEDRHGGLWRGYSSQYVRYHLRGETRPGALVRAVALEPFGDGVLGRIDDAPVKGRS